MPSKFLAEILTPDRSFFCGEIESMIVPAADGYISIQKMHEPVVVAVVPGVIRMQIDGVWKECSVSAGFLEVRPDEIILFATTAEWPEEIDIGRAERARQQAEEALRQKRSMKEYQENQIALARAMARLKVGRKNPNM